MKDLLSSKANKKRLEESVKQDITMKITKKQKTAIFQALGKASMCWDKTPTGVYDSSNAERIGNELIKILEQ